MQTTVYFCPDVCREYWGSIPSDCWALIKEVWGDVG
jgi:hypothetical protein